MDFKLEIVSKNIIHIGITIQLEQNEDIASAPLIQSPGDRFKPIAMMSPILMRMVATEI